MKLAFVAALLVVGVACSSDDDDSTTTSLSRQPSKIAEELEEQRELNAEAIAIFDLLSESEKIEWCWVMNDDRASAERSARETLRARGDMTPSEVDDMVSSLRAVYFSEC